MAIELMARIMGRPREELDASEKWVLVVMADRADDDGLLWYAMDTIADKCSLTRRAVQKIMDRLIAKRLVKKVQRTNRSNFFQIQVDRLPAVERQRRSKETGPIEFVRALEDDEPDLFVTGERRSKTADDGRTTFTPPVNVVPFTSEPGSPDSLNDPLEDSLNLSDALARRVMDRWNVFADTFPKAEFSHVETMGETRMAQLLARTDEWAKGWKKAPLDDLAGAMWARAFDFIENSRLCTGQSTDWRISIDWMLKKANFRKIMEGNYGTGRDRIGTQGVGAGSRSAVEAGRDALAIVEAHRGRAGRSPDRAASAH